MPLGKGWGRFPGPVRVGTWPEGTDAADGRRPRDGRAGDARRCVAAIRAADEPPERADRRRDARRARARRRRATRARPARRRRARLRRLGRRRARATPSPGCARALDADPGLAPSSARTTTRPRRPAPSRGSATCSTTTCTRRAPGRRRRSGPGSARCAATRSRRSAASTPSATRTPSIEDIELGAAPDARPGARIRLDPAIQGTHLKAWTLRGHASAPTCGAAACPWVALAARPTEGSRR